MNINHPRVGTGIVSALGGSLLIFAPFNVAALDFVRACPGLETDDNCVVLPATDDDRDAAGDGVRPGRVTVERSSAAPTVGSDRHLENLAADIAAKRAQRISLAVFPTVGDMLAYDAALYVQRSAPTVGSDRHLENLAADIAAKSADQQS